MHCFSKLFLLAQSFPSALLGACAEAYHKLLSGEPVNAFSGRERRPYKAILQGKGSTRTQTQDLMSSPYTAVTGEFPLVEFSESSPRQDKAMSALG